MNPCARCFALIAVLTAVWLAPSAAAACKCALVAPNEAAEQAGAVFEGRVVEVSDVPGDLPRRSATFRVVRTWKGMKSETATVTTASDSAACGVAFERDQNYLVYASVQDGALSATSCSRTRSVTEAEEDFKALGMGWTPVDAKTEDSAKPNKPEPPAKGGCASCSIGAASASTPAAVWLLPAMLLWAVRSTYRRRSGSRS